MKKSHTTHQDETTTQKLKLYNSVEPDKRDLLRGIVSSAPEDIKRTAQLNTFFTSDAEDVVRAGWLGGVRVYAGLAVIALVVLGSGVLWFNFSRPNTAQNTSQFSADQLQANGKVANTLNTINQQTSSEVDTALSGQVDSTTSTPASTELQQMQESINEKF